jgi:hypothetical protein
MVERGGHAPDLSLTSVSLIRFRPFPTDRFRSFSTFDFAAANAVPPTQDRPHRTLVRRGSISAEESAVFVNFDK